MSKLSGLLYDSLLEPLLNNWKSKIASLILKKPMGVTLDICCGTGKQCRIIAQNSAAIGVDLNFEILQFAHSRAPHIPFVCADAQYLPFKPRSFQHIVISLALHDKPEHLRQKMIREAKQTLRTNARLLLLDFEKPSTRKSKIGYSFINLIEFMAGTEHFRNGREFVKSGGLKSFLLRNDLEIERIHASSWGSSSIIETVTYDS